MPQVDIPQVFAVPRPPSPATDALSPDHTNHRVATDPQPSLLHRLQLHGPHWANLAFVLAACMGAIFCGAYLFKGGELLQEVAAWPRELFVARPTPSPAKGSQERALVRLNLTTESTGQFEKSSGSSGDPFSPARKLLSGPGLFNSQPNRARATEPFSSASAILDNLRQVGPGAHAHAFQVSERTSQSALAQGLATAANAQESLAQQMNTAAIALVGRSDSSANLLGVKGFVARSTAGDRHGLTTSAQSTARQSLFATQLQPKRVGGGLVKSTIKRPHMRNVRHRNKLIAAQNIGKFKPWAIFSRIRKRLLRRKSHVSRKTDAKWKTSPHPGRVIMGERPRHSFGPGNSAFPRNTRPPNSHLSAPMRGPSPMARPFSGMTGPSIAPVHAFGRPSGR